MIAQTCKKKQRKKEALDCFFKLLVGFDVVRSCVRVPRWIMRTYHPRRVKDCEWCENGTHYAPNLLSLRSFCIGLGTPAPAYIYLNVHVQQSAVRRPRSRPRQACAFLPQPFRGEITPVQQ